MRHLVFGILLVLTGSSCSAWSPSGHHVVAVLAAELMPTDVRAEVFRILKEHPDWDRYFRPPSSIAGNAGSAARWQFGIAGCWPDMVRGTDADRPMWHYRLGATMVLGDAKLPRKPPQLRPTDTLETKELYITAATRLCIRVFSDRSSSDADRAVALCWLLHLYADGHQPCHAGSLYCPAFPTGDRGANAIPLVDGNLHSSWDRLLGNRADANEIRRRVSELGDVRAQYRSIANEGGGAWLMPETWLAESVRYGRTHVYTDEVLQPVVAASRGMTGGIPKLKLSTTYFQNAGEVARERAKLAGYRLALLLTLCVRRE
ncbi:MAG: S1/P1 nuclease [Planctomycetota bacterium]